MLTFLGIGAQKCGTTWLYEQLRRHPEIGFPAGKEIHFWNTYYERGVEWYQELFQDRHTMEGDITPAYAALPKEVIEEIRHYFSEIRLIYIVRKPQERAWSSALMGLNRAQLEIDEASDQWFIDHFNSAGSRGRSDYKTCMDNWLAVFPRDQLLILDFADIAVRPRKFLRRCAVHIGVAPEALDKKHPSLQKKVFPGPGYALRPQLKPILDAIYEGQWEAFQPYIDELE